MNVRLYAARLDTASSPSLRGRTDRSPYERVFDIALIVAYLIGITLFGLRFRDKKGSGSRSLESYFLADRSIPWWAIALSIVSAETSTLTIISVPGVAFAGDFGFLQIVLGYMVGRIVVALLFLPKYFQGQMLTAYQLIDRRFGSALHNTTAGLFPITRDQHVEVLAQNRQRPGGAALDALHPLPLDGSIHERHVRAPENDRCVGPCCLDGGGNRDGGRHLLDPHTVPVHGRTSVHAA